MTLDLIQISVPHHHIRQIAHLGGKKELQEVGAVSRRSAVLSEPTIGTQENAAKLIITVLEAVQVGGKWRLGGGAIRRDIGMVPIREAPNTIALLEVTPSFSETAARLIRVESVEI